MKRKSFNCLAALFLLLFFSSFVNASQCVNCHTDVVKLKEVAKTIPKPIASAETAGKG